MILTPQLLRWTIRDISFLLYHWVVIVNRNMRSAALRCLGIVGLRSFMEDGGGTAAAVMVMVMVDVDCGFCVGARARHVAAQVELSTPSLSLSIFPH